VATAAPPGRATALSGGRSQQGLADAGVGQDKVVGGLAEHPLLQPAGFALAARVPPAPERRAALAAVEVEPLPTGRLAAPATSCQDLCHGQGRAAHHAGWDAHAAPAPLRLPPWGLEQRGPRSPPRLGPGAWGLAPRRGPPRPTRGQAGGPLLCKAGGQTTRHTAWGPPRVTGGPPRGARARGRGPPSPPTRTWRVGAITVHPQDGERSSRFLAAASLRSPALRARRTADHASRCRGSRGTSPRQARAQARRGAAASIRPGHPGCAAPSKPRAVARLPSPAAPQARPRTSSAAAAGWPGKIGPGGSGQEPSHAVPCPGRQGPPGGGPWARRWFRPRQPRESPVLEGQPGLDGSTVRGRRLVSGMGAGRRGGGGWGSPVSGLPNPP